MIKEVNRENDTDLDEEMTEPTARAKWPTDKVRGKVKRGSWSRSPKLVGDSEGAVRRWRSEEWED